MDNVELWKNLSKSIISEIKYGNTDNLDKLFDKRQEILDKVDLKEFKKSLGNSIKLDDEIMILLMNEMEKTKKDIQNYKKTKNANFSYQRNLTKKINIFNQKI